ncbi:hypothetical protein ABMA27_012301 [Loxostege sticticalis]|uniref:G2/M phase-specific E3 ubiquitin-protein ligase n=1 Tax=Loxostege sticticalis TaxID=481309 RepID=A0ABR3H0T4_LOXSC
MAKKVSRDKKLLAKLVTETEDRKPCAFCQREIDDEITYGKLYSIGNIQCHYFCVLLSCCLIQKGKDEEGLFGFLYPDILAELERSKKHKCSYCGRDGATLGCSLSQCRKQFHLPCGRERNAVSLFYGNFKSFCQNHAPKQKVTEEVMAKAKVRMQADRKNAKAVVAKTDEDKLDDDLSEDSVCVICYEAVQRYPTPQTFWPPCCARDKWFHRACLQRMALSAGMHYLKCPLCNDKDSFYQAVINQGYYVPDRDAAWELEQNAFAEIYERELACNLPECLCPLGRDHDSDNGPWDIKLCLLCGSTCAHAQCLLASGSTNARYVCTTCDPAAPQDLEELAACVEKVVLASQANSTRSGPVMPSRMSLRRTKQRQAYYSKYMRRLSINIFLSAVSNNLASSRQDLNLKTPRRFPQDTDTTILKGIENTLLSPMKLIEQGFKDKPSVLEKVRHKFRQPKPWSVKKKIVDNILDDLVGDMMKQKKTKTKEPLREWLSPKKEPVNVGDKSQTVKQETAQPQNIEEIQPEAITSPEKPDTITPQETTNLTTPTDNTPQKDHTTVETHSPQKTKESDALPKTSTPRKTEKTQDLETTAIDDEDTRSTFELPPEFIGEDSNSIPILDTPKKLKTVEIQKDSSMEISENNDVVNIHLVKIENANNVVLKFSDVASPSPVKSEKCAFKFSPKDKESLEKNKIDIDLESFKNQYLNEVDRDFQCKFSHKHSDSKKSFKLQTAIDFAIDAASKERKRKLKSKKKSGKKRKLEEKVERKSEKKDKKHKKKLKLVYVWKSNSSLNLSPSKSDPHKTLKQYVLKYSDNMPGEIIGKPEKDVTPMKRKQFKNDRSPDNLVQTSIQSFFKSKSSKE